ncbi:hypothetical protein E6C27_scaffold515G00040 [Cucumis melo var. makuwa]|uniref:Uncharacterized protein n=1 Tax=Cucumis melo var. makuwa TaxID=1194695 RepID=A0A5A7T049_CUCMM|nr:hypothetical protein E6C27_scaffold515G00040 [Cucumis melo var. makuwa]
MDGNAKGSRALPLNNGEAMYSYILLIERYLQQDIPGGVCTQTRLSRVITLHQNKEEEHYLKIVGQVKDPKGMENEDIPPLTPTKRKAASTSTL